MTRASLFLMFRSARRSFRTGTGDLCPTNLRSRVFKWDLELIPEAKKKKKFQIWRGGDSSEPRSMYHARAALPIDRRVFYSSVAVGIFRCQLRANFFFAAAGIAFVIVIYYFYFYFCSLSHCFCCRRRRFYRRYFCRAVFIVVIVIFVIMVFANAIFVVPSSSLSSSLLLSFWPFFRCRRFCRCPYCHLYFCYCRCCVVVTVFAVVVITIFVVLVVPSVAVLVVWSLSLLLSLFLSLSLLCRPVVVVIAIFVVLVVPFVAASSSFGRCCYRYFCRCRYFVVVVLSLLSLCLSFWLLFSLPSSSSCRCCYRDFCRFGCCFRCRPRRFGVVVVVIVIYFVVVGLSSPSLSWLFFFFVLVLFSLSTSSSSLLLVLTLRINLPLCAKTATVANSITSKCVTSFICVAVSLPSSRTNCLNKERPLLQTPTLHIRLRVRR